MQAAFYFLPDGNCCFLELSIPEFSLDDLDRLKRDFVIHGLYPELRCLFEVLETAAHRNAIAIMRIAAKRILRTLQPYLILGPLVA